MLKYIKKKVAAICDYPIIIRYLQRCKQPIYNANEDAISANSSGDNFNFSRRKSTSFSLFIGIKWMCACATSSPKTTIATFLQPVCSLILCATRLANIVIPANVSSSRSK